METEQQPSPGPLPGAQSGQGAHGGAPVLCLEGGTVTKSVDNNLDHLRINLSIKTKFNLFLSELEFSLSSHL